jgi:hypothetical protein
VQLLTFACCTTSIRATYAIAKPGWRMPLLCQVLPMLAAYLLYVLHLHSTSTAGQHNMCSHVTMTQHMHFTNMAPLLLPQQTSYCYDMFQAEMQRHIFGCASHPITSP